MESKFLDDNFREFAELAAKCSTEGLFGLKIVSPQKYYDDLRDSLLHPKAAAIYRDGTGKLNGAAYLFRNDKSSVWELRLALDSGLNLQDRSNIRGLLLKNLTTRCTELGVSIFHCGMSKEPPEAELLEVGFLRSNVLEEEYSSSEVADRIARAAKNGDASRYSWKYSPNKA